MRPVLTASEFRRVDSAHPGLAIEAMEIAGHAVALEAARLGAGYGSKVVILAGPGNNGGDGYVAARHLIGRGAAVEVHRLGEPRTQQSAAAMRRAIDSGIRIRELGDVVECDLVVDAIFGGAGRSGVPHAVRNWMTTPAPVLAVDFPTGLEPDSGKVDDVAFMAERTVTFGSLKTGHLLGAGPDHCGELCVVDIGISAGRPSLFVAEEGDAARPIRPRRAHKWSAGSVLVVGGSSGLVGAAALAGRAALAFGAGSVYVASPAPDTVTQIAPQLPSLGLDQAVSMLGRFDVSIIGPGLAEADLEAALPVVAKSPRLVLDAGALRPDVIQAATADQAEVVVTPHAREFERIAGVGPGTYSTRAYAAKTGVVVLRKGNPTLITAGGPPILVRSGGPELATIGTGDVLSGMIGALWARGLGGLDAAVSAAYWHGRAASDLASRRSVTADQLADWVGAYAS